jgi:hypothetical protein
MEAEFQSSVYKLSQMETSHILVKSILFVSDPS